MTLRKSSICLYVLCSAGFLLLAAGCGSKQDSKVSRLQGLQNLINNPNTPPDMKAADEQQYQYQLHLSGKPLQGPPTPGPNPSPIQTQQPPAP